MPSISGFAWGVWSNISHGAQTTVAKATGLSDYKQAWKNLTSPKRQDSQRIKLREGHVYPNGTMVIPQTEYEQLEVGYRQRVSDCWQAAEKGLMKNGAVLGAGAIVTGTGFALRGLEALEQRFPHAVSTLCGGFNEESSPDCFTYASEIFKNASHVSQRAFEGMAHLAPKMLSGLKWSGEKAFTAGQYTVLPVCKGLGKGAVHVFHNYPLATVVGSAATVLVALGACNLAGKKTSHEHLELEEKSSGKSHQAVYRRVVRKVVSDRKRSWTDTGLGVSEIALGLSLIVVPWAVGGK